MARIVCKSRPKVEVSVTFTVNEEEARALEALASYGEDSAVEAFYKFCGTHYMKPYEAGFRSFLSSIGACVSPALSEVDRLREMVLKAKESSG